jgi:flavin-dependent dehydrogenase
MLRAVVEEGFQFKNGAAFVRGAKYTDFDFRDKYSVGWGTTYQVPRARFDHLLALEAERQGAEVLYRHEVVAADFERERPSLTVQDPGGARYVVDAGFVLDASGFGRVLARLLKLETPSDFPVRGSLFCHVEDGIPLGALDRNKIRITVHPEHSDVWYWLIPFADGRSSVGVVAEPGFLEDCSGTNTERLRTLVAEDPSLGRLLARARWDMPARRIIGYSSNVKSLWGRGYALLGNAGEFLDPIFSSGVTIAFKSASLATTLLPRQFAGEAVDWSREYAVPLKKGVDTFRAFVRSWYAGGLQQIIFHEQRSRRVERMISAVLAGYAWDQTNPFVREPKRLLAALEAVCAPR